MNRFFEPETALTLQTINRYFDGLPVWEEHDIHGRLLYEKRILSNSEHPCPVYCAVFLIPTGNREPQPGNRIKYNNQLYDITSVEHKYTLSGTLAAYRCTCGRE